MIYRQNRLLRKGMILLVVVAFLALFSVMGITYIIYADSQLRQTGDDVNGQDVRQNPLKSVDLDPSFILNFFLERFLYDQADISATSATPDSVYSALRGHSLSRNMYGWNDTANALNDKPFNGTGKLNRQIMVEGQNIEEWKIVNHTAFNPSTLPILDPERGLRTGGNRSAPNSSWNAPYTYPDHNNFYLGWLKSDGTKIQPSFHREYIFGSMKPVDGNPNWTNAIGKYLTPRPRPIEHNGFPYPEPDGMDVKNLEGYPGGNDSIWIDVGSPVFKSTDGRKYKIMIAPLILDLDGKLNLNVAGNAMGAGGSHGSNQGWGPWEVNPGKVAQPAEIQALISSFPSSGSAQLAGRYTNNPRTPTGANGAIGNYPNSPPYAMVDYNGSVDVGAGGIQGPLKIPTFNDGNASPFQSFPYFPTQNWGGAGATEITDGTNYNHASFYNPLRPSTDNRVFSPRETSTLLNWGSKSSTLSSSSLMQFFPNSMDPQNPNTTNPQNTQTIKNRSFVTTLSSDLARITTPPYIANSMGSLYQMNGNYPKGNDIAYTPNGTGVPVGSNSDTETFTDGMGNTATVSLRSINSRNMKVDLSRKLADYPGVSYPSVSRNTTDLPFQSNFYFDVTKNGDMKFVPGTDVAAQTADLERQQCAMDIFQALILATGAKQVNQVPLVQNDLDFKALKYLAQLAVNMVDYIDKDDVMTCFTWKKDPGGNPSLDEKVFGFEIPKLVINEGYAEIINGGADAGNDFTAYIDANNMMKKKAKNDFEVHFWFELLNPMNDSQVQSASQNAWLEQDPFNLSNSRSPIYQIEVVDKMNNRKLLLGDPNAPPSFYTPDNSTKFLDSNVTLKPFHFSNLQNYEERATKFVFPALQNQYQGALSSNSGFFVMGSTRDFPGSNNAQLEMTNLRHPMLSYPMPKGVFDDVNNKFSSANIEQTITGLQNHRVIIRRLANPYKPYNNDPADLRFNPFVEVDNLSNLNVNDAVKYAADEERTDPTPNPNPGNIPTKDWYLQMTDKEQRTSKAKRSPYKSSALATYLDININPMTKKHDTRLRIPSTNSPGFVLQPAVGKPQTSLLRHNATWVDTSSQQFPYKVLQNMVLVPKTTNAGVYYQSVLDEELNRMVPDVEWNLSSPITWLVHLDRAPVSLPELMHVSGVAPKDVTTAFRNGAFTDGTNSIGHKAPWLDGGSRLARFLEFAQVKSRQAGVAQDGRIPGLVNINSIWDQEIFSALCDANGNNNFTQAEVDAIFAAMVGGRSPYGEPRPNLDPNTMMPTQPDKPFWSLGVGKSAGGDDWTANPRGLDNTILRNNGTLFDLPAVNGAGQNRDDYQRKELLTKIFNSMTTKSNTFGVWLTAGFFEVTDDTVKPAKLGAEIGKADGTNIRHRMFAIIDRTNMINAKNTGLAVNFKTNVNGLLQDINGSPLPPINLGKPVLINPANNANTNLVNGMTVTLDANTDYEETVAVVLDVNGDFWFTPKKLHYPTYIPAMNPNPAYYQNTIGTIINRGNPGPWLNYDRTKDRDVVPYAEVIE